MNFRKFFFIGFLLYCLFFMFNLYLILKRDRFDYYDLFTLATYLFVVALYFYAFKRFS